MDYFKAIQISAAGMAAQQARVEAATLNLANMNTTAAPGAPGYRPVTAVIHAVPAFSQVLGGQSRPLVIHRRRWCHRSGPRRAPSTSRGIRMLTHPGWLPTRG